mgnify:CR=1 FL=1
MSLAVKSETDLALTPEWTPETLKEAVEREGQLREIVIGYYRSQMKQGHHYFSLPGQDHRKPALAKEGALNLCSLFKVTPEPDEPHETSERDRHYSVRFRYRLRSVRTGNIVATGDGFCTTREDKYASRWVWLSDLPQGFDKELLPSRKVKTRKGWMVKYKVANDDLASQYNTVLKMASKRALVDAALKLPLVSELFTQDLEEQIAERGAEVEDEPHAEAQPANVDTQTGEIRDESADRKSAMQGLMRAMATVKLSAEHVRALSKRMFGKASASDLTTGQLTELADEIEGVHVSQHPETVPVMETEKGTALSRLLDLTASFGLSSKDLRARAKAQFGKESSNDLTADELTQLAATIEADFKEDAKAEERER